MRKIVALLSGGISSSVMLAELVNQGHAVKALSFDYGQRHSKEITSAKLIANYLDVPIEIVNLSSLRSLIAGDSALMNYTHKVPTDLDNKIEMRKTDVPNITMILISVAIGHAIALGYESVAYGGNDFEFFKHEIGINILKNNREKKADVCIGKKLNLPLHHTWSCYNGQMVHCGKCKPCHDRKEAFSLSCVEDLTKYTG